MKRAVSIEGWTWTADIGLFWGEGPNGERESVSRPVMTSPWWVIGDPDPLAGKQDYVYPDGFTTLLFAESKHAVWQVIATHRPPVVVDPETSFEVWVRNLRTGEVERRGWGSGGSLDLATTQMERFNAEEVENARMEQRPVRREFFIIEATTTYKVHEG